MYIEKFKVLIWKGKWNIKIKELPEGERPYEKLELYGEKNLSNAELLAIIIKTGTKEKTSVDIAKQILKLNNNVEKDDLSFIQDISLEEFTNIKGIGRVKAIQLKAVCELAKRLNKPTNYRKIVIKEPKDVANLLTNELRFLKKEIFKVIILNNKNVILKIVDIAIGTSNMVNMKIADILSEAIKINAPKIIIVHNHPSGNSSPSKQDFIATENIKKGAELLGITLLDHIIIGNQNYSSIMSIKKQRF